MIPTFFLVLRGIQEQGDCINYLFDVFHHKHASSTLKAGKRDTMHTMTQAHLEGLCMCADA